MARELAAEGARRYRRRASTTELSGAQLAHVHRRLEVCPGIRGTTLWAEPRADYGFRASFATFQRLLRPLRPAVVREPEIRFETGRGVQTQADWAHLGLWPLGDHMVELYATVAILGCSRAPAIRFATDLTRPTSFERLVRCLDDLGGVTAEILADRDPAFCIGSISDGRAILAPEWWTSARSSAPFPEPAGPTVPRPRARSSGWSASSGRASWSGSATSRCHRARRSTTTTRRRAGGSRRSCCGFRDLASVRRPHPGKC